MYTFDKLQQTYTGQCFWSMTNLNNCLKIIQDFRKGKTTWMKLLNMFASVNHKLLHVQVWNEKLQCIVKSYGTHSHLYFGKTCAKVT